MAFLDPLEQDGQLEGLPVPAHGAEGTPGKGPAPAIPVLRPLLDTPFAGCVATMRLAAEGEASGRPASDLLEPPVMAATMRRFRPEDWPRDPRAVFSFWSQHYFLRLLPPALAANLLFGQRLPLDLAEVRVVLDREGLPALFRVKLAGRPPLPAGAHLPPGHRTAPRWSPVLGASPSEDQHRYFENPGPDEHVMPRSSDKGRGGVKSQPMKLKD